MLEGGVGRGAAKCPPPLGAQGLIPLNRPGWGQSPHTKSHAAKRGYQGEPPEPGGRAQPP